MKGGGGMVSKVSKLYIQGGESQKRLVSKSSLYTEGSKKAGGGVSKDSNCNIRGGEGIQDSRFILKMTITMSKNEIKMLVKK